MSVQRQEMMAEIERIVRDVLEAMPVRFQTSGRVEVEVNRMIVDHIRAGRWQTEQEHHLLDEILPEVMQSHGIEIARRPGQNPPQST